MNTPAETLTRYIERRNTPLTAYLAGRRMTIADYIAELKAIRSNRSYKPLTFSQFLKQTSGISRTHADRLISGKPKKKKHTVPDHLRWSVWERDNFTCCYCSKRRYLEVDHVVPECEGGATSLENLVTSCRKCNREKGKKGAWYYTSIYRPLSVFEEVVLGKTKA